MLVAKCRRRSAADNADQNSRHEMKVSRRRGAPVVPPSFSNTHHTQHACSPRSNAIWKKILSKWGTQEKLPSAQPSQLQTTAIEEAAADNLAL
mmetsp:Transcript_57757/g.101152  ORF Transcript_57757/g.101152 Transcript_57757/m.101152 type:complete len:93 (+) Transcript_57757:1870-2148(+)